MTTFDITTNAGLLAAAIRNSPSLIARYLTPALDKSTQEIARTAKQNVRANDSMAHSVLINSIQSAVSGGGLEAIVYAGANYAKYVEEGTKGGGYPSQQTIIDWLRVRNIRPNNPETSESELAYLIARKIALHGTPAQPFFFPAFESEKAAAISRVQAAVQQAIREIH